MTKSSPSRGTPPPEAEEQARRIIEAARLLGVSVDEADVAQWLTALAAGQSPGQDWQVDTRAGVFGHRLTLLDFDPASLERYRRIADIVQFPDRPNVETAIALSRSCEVGRHSLIAANFHLRDDDSGAAGGRKHQKSNGSKIWQKV